MIKIYADIHKDPRFVYVEDKLSSHDICHASKDDFKAFIKSMINEYGEIHTCYSPFLSHVGRFIYEYGKRWCGQEFVVYTTKLGRFGRELKLKQKHKFDVSGRVQNWTIGYF